MKSAVIKKDEPHYQAAESEDVKVSDQLEVRVARIESDVQHIKEVTTDLRVELRRTNDKIDALDAKVDAKFSASDTKVDGKFSALEGKLDGVKDKLHSITVWALLLYIALAGSLLTVLAKGFKWF
jgi:ABC-type phosphate transport system auxiliary subunit